MGAKGEADLRAVRQQFAELTRTLAKVDPGRSKEPLLPRIVEALDPFMNEELRHRVRDDAIQADRVRDALVAELIIPTLRDLIDTSVEVSSTAPLPTGNDGPAGMISVADFSLLSASMELLVLWGIYPYLEPGVGIRLEKRADFKGARFPARLLAWGMEVAPDEGSSKETPTDPSGEENDPAVAHEQEQAAAPLLEGHGQLLACADVLEAAMQMHQYALFFRSRHGADLVALYLQLALRRPPEDSIQREAKGRLEALFESLGPAGTLTILRDLVSRGKEAPAWLRQECSGRMTSTLLRSGGVRAVLEAFLGHVGNDDEDSHAHMRVADLLAARPRGMSAGDYMAALAPQLPPLFHTQGEQRPKVLRLASLVVTRLCEKMPHDTRRRVLRPLLDALVRTRLPSTPSHPTLVAEEGVVLSREEEVSLALVDLEGLLFSFPPRPALLESLANTTLLRSLLRLYAFASQAKLEVMGRVEACVAEIVNTSRRGHFLLVDAFVHLDRGDTVFAPGGSGAAELRTRRREEEGAGCERMAMLRNLTEDAAMEKMLTRLGQNADVVVRLLGTLGTDSKVPGLVFERLLFSFLLLKLTGKEERALVLEACDGSGNADLRAKDTPTPTDSAEASSHEQEGEEAASLLVLLEKVGQALGGRVFGSGAQILRCCRLLLLLVLGDSHVDDGPVTSAEGEEGVIEELASVVLGLLGVVLEVGEERREEEEEKGIRELLPLLERMARRSDRPALAEMAQTLQAMILTRGLSLEERREQREREGRAAVEAGRQAGGPAAALQKLLEDVQKDLRADSAPMRARGVCSLTKVIHATPSSCLVEDGSELVKGLLTQLVTMLRDKESYVYLAAVHGLAVLSERAPAQVIPDLVKCLEGRDGQGLASIPERLRAGEALVLAARRCGEAMPKYAPQMIPAFILGARPPPKSPAAAVGSDEGWEVCNFRASCLSNLAEVCGLLGWSLQRYVEDVCDLGLGILRIETYARGQEGQQGRELVRRGAVFLLTRMIAGTEARLLSLLPRQLPDVARVLERAAEQDDDPVTRFHASRALGEIESLIEEQLQTPLDVSTYVSPIEQLTQRLEAWGNRNKAGGAFIQEVSSTRK